MFFSWWRKLSALRSKFFTALDRQPLHRRRSTLRLQMETLEERLAPAVRIWSGAGADAFWSNPQNWVGNVAPTAGDDLIFGAAAQTVSTNDLAAGTVFNSIQFTTDGYNVTGNAIQLNGSIAATHTSGDNIFNIDVTLLNATTFVVGNAGATLTFSGNVDTAGLVGHTGILGTSSFIVDGAGVLHISGVVSGSSGIFKQGPGTLILSGANTYEGITEVRQGVITVRHDMALGAVTGHTLVAVGAALNIEGDGLSINEPLAINDGGVGFGDNTSSEGLGALRNLSGTNTWTGGIELVAANNIIGVDTGSTLIVSGVIGSSQLTQRNLYKAGGGTLQFAGTQANTYHGDTTVLQGTLELNKRANPADPSTGFAAFTRNLTIGTHFGGDDDAVVRLLADNQIPHADRFGTTFLTVTINSSGLLDLNNFDTAIGNLNLFVGSTFSADVATGSGTLFLMGNVLVTGFQGSSGASPAATISGNLHLADAFSGGTTALVNRTFTVNDTQLANIAADLHISANITGSAAVDFVKLGTGTLRLSGSNTFAGPLLHSAGLIEVEGNSALGTGLVSIQGTGYLSAVGSSVLITNPISLDGTLSTYGDHDFEFSGPATLSANRVIQVMNANQTVVFSGGIVQGPFATANLTKQGRGTLVISGASTYSGTTVIDNDGGTLILRDQGTILNSSAITVGINASLILDNSVPGGNLSDRLHDQAPITLNGRLVFVGAEGEASSEQVGFVTTLDQGIGVFESQVSTTPGSSSHLIVGGLTGGSANRTVIFVGTGADLSHDGPNRISFIRTPVAPQNGIISTAVVRGASGETTFGTYASVPEGIGIIPLPASGYHNDINTALAIHNVRLAAGVHTLNQSMTINSLILEDGAILNLADGATLFINQTSNLILGNGSEINGPGVLVLGNLNTTAAAASATIHVPEGAIATINAETFGATSALTKSGRGTLVLTGDNKFGGVFNINEGVVNIQHSRALGTTATAVNVRHGASLELEESTNGPINVGVRTLNLQGTGFNDTGVLRNVAGNNSWAGNVGQAGNAFDVSALVGGFAGTTGAILSPINRTAVFYDVAAGTTLTLSGVVSGNIDLIKRGEGTLEFAGTSANTVNAVVRILEGELLFNKVPGLNSVAGGTIVIGDGLGGDNADVLRLGGGDQIPDGVRIYVMSSGLFDLNGHGDAVGQLLLEIGPTAAGDINIGTGGILTITTNPIVLSQGSGNPIGATISGGTFALQLFGTVTTPGTRTFNVNDGAVGSDLIISSAIVDGTGLQSVGIIKTGFGSLELTGLEDNTFSGTTTVQEGELLLNKGNGSGNVLALMGPLTIGDNTITSGYGRSDVVRLLQSEQLPDFLALITIQSTGLLDLNGFDETIGTTFIQNALVLNTGVVETGGGTLTINGNIATTSAQTPTGFAVVVNPAQINGGNLHLNAPVTDIAVAAHAGLTIDAIISANISGDTTIRKLTGGSGLLLSGNNSYGGDTYLTAGTLAVGSNTPVGLGMLFASSNTLIYAVDGPRTLSNNVQLGGGATTHTLGYWNNLNLAGPVTLYSGTTTVNVSTAVTVEFSGGVGNKVGAVNLAKAGYGRLVLSDGTAHGGTTVVNTNGGHLIVSGQGRILNTTSYTVNVGGHLVIDNDSGGNLPDRIEDTIPITLTGGTLAFVGASGADSSERVGVVTLSANFGSTIQVLGDGSFDSILTIASLTRGGASTVNFMGRGVDLGPTSTNQVVFNLMPLRTGPAGSEILPYAVVTSASGQVDAATHQGHGTSIQAFTNYSTGDINNAPAGSVYLLDSNQTLTSNLSLNGIVVRGNGVTLSGDPGVAVTLTGGAIINGGATLALPNVIAVPDIILANEGIVQTYGTLDIQSAIGQSGARALTLAGSGRTIASGTGVNTYSGATVINSGIYRAAKDTAFGTTAGNVIVSYGATVELDGGITVPAETITLNGSGEGITSNIPLRNISGENTWQGNVVLAANRTGIAVDAGRLIINGVVSGASIGFNKFGEGILQFGGGGNNSNSGTNFIWQGTVELNKTPGLNALAAATIVGDHVGGNNADALVLLADDQIPNVTITINSSGLFDLNGNSETFTATATAALTAINMHTGPAASAELRIGSGTLTLDNTSFAKNITVTTTIVGGSSPPALITGTTGSLNIINGTSTITVNDSDSLDDLIISAIISGDGNFTKAGNGRMVLSGDNSFTGNVTVAAGELALRHANALGAPGGTNSVTAGAAVILQNVNVSGETLTLNGNGPGNSGALRNDIGDNEWSGDIILNTASRVGVEAGTTLTLSGSIQGGGGLIKELPGTLIYSGAVANTYIGNTTIQEGTLILNKSVANGAIAAGTLIIGNNAGGPGADVVQIGLGAGTPQQIAAGVAVTINTSGLLDLNGNNMAIGGLTTITAGPTFSGSIALSGATLTLNGDVTVNVMGTMTSAAPGAEIGGGTLAFSAARTFTVNNNALHLRELVISANILSSANLLKAGAGDLLLTADNSSFSGNVQLGGGTLAVGHDNALGTGALNVTAAAVILADGGSRTIANNVNLSAALTVRGDQDFTFGGTIAQTVAAGALTTNQAGGTSIIFANSIILLNASTLLITTSTFRAITEVSGVISDGAGTGGIVKAGTGVLILSNANTYKGVTQVNAGGGILRVTHGDALGSTTGTTTVNTNAALELLGSFTIAENLSFQGANARGVPGLEDGALRVVGSSSDVTWAGTITLGTGNGQFNAIGVDAGSRLIVSGEIGQLVSNVGLIKVGDGTLQLASPTGNTFAGGLIVRQGTLELNVGAGNSFAGNLTIGDHGGGANSDRVVLLASDQIPTVTVTLMASGQLDLSANGGQFDLISLFAMQRIWNVAPSIVTGAGTLQINTTSTMISATGYFTDGTTPAGTIEGNLNLGGAGRTITVNDTFVASDAEDLVISAVIGQTAAAGVTKSGNGTLALLGSNTFTGTTTVNAAFNTSARGFTGSLVLRGGGTLNNATGGAVTVNSGATLVLDNSAGSVDRIRDTSTVTLAGGMLDFIAHEDGTTEQIGTLTINAGNNTANSVIRSTKTGDGDAQFIATSLTRGAGGLVHFIGVGADLGELAVTGNEIRINGGTNPFVNGVLPYGTIEGPSSSLDLVRDADGVVSAPYIIGRVVSYATDINTPNGIVRLDGTEPAANRILTGNVTIAALLIDGNNVVISEDVAGRTLTINPGAQSGLVVNRGTGNEITVSTLAFAARDPIFNIVSGDMGVSAAITGTAAMRKEGSGELIFTGNNIGFTNSITINNGVLRVGHNNALGTATNVAGTSTIVNSLAQLVLDASLATGGTLTIGNELLNVANGLAIADNGRRGAVVAVGGVTTWGTGTTSITLNAGLTVIDVHADSELVWAGTLNNNITTASLLKIGGGVLELAGTASNITNTGPFFINEGTVRLNKTGDGINAMRMNVVIGDFSGTDVLEYGPTAGNDQIQDATARTVQVTPSGVWNLNNINDRIAGAVTMTGGTITTGSGTLILANNLTVTTSAAPATISGNLDLAAGTRTFTVNDAAGDIGLTISANVSNGTFAKAGTGTLLFSGARTHTGTVNLSAGTLALDDPGALGTATLNVTANSTLRGEGIDLVGANAITNNVNRTGGTLTLGGRRDFGGVHGIELAGSVVMANPGSPAVIGFAVQDPLVHAEISGTISGGGSNLIFGKSGTGTLILSGNNTFLVRPTAGSGVNLDQADGIRIDAGILRVAHSNALGGGGYANVNVRGDLGAALEIDGTAGNVDITNRHLILFGPDNGIARGYLNRTSSEAVATGVLRNIAGTNRVTGQIDLRNIGTSTTNAVTIYIGVDAGRLDLNGQIIGTTNVAGTTTVNNRNLYKVGEGTLRYSGGAGNTINGNTVVIAGTLELNKSAGNAIAGPLIIGDNEGAAGSDQVVLLNNNQIADNTTTVTIQSTGSLVLGDFQDAIFGPTGTNTNVLSLVLGDGKSASVSSTNLGALILGRNTTNTSGILVTPRPGVSNVVPATIEGNLQLRTATDSAGRTRQITVDDSPADVELLVTANILNGGVDDTTNGAVNKLGLGRMVLNPDDASTYTGNTTVSAGVLQVQKSEALGLGTTVTVAAGASLELDGDLTINKNLNASGTGLFNGPVSTRRVAPEGTGAVRSISGDSTWTGNVSLNANPTVFRNEAGTSLTLNGAITLGATGNEFVKTGEGTLILAGTTDNIITSVSFVLSGTLVLNKQGTANALRGTLVIGDEFSPATVQYGPDAGTAQMLNTAAILISSTGILDLATNDKTDQFGEIRLTVGATSSSQIHTGSGAAVLTNNTFRVITMPGTTTLSPAALVTGNLHLGPSGTVTRTFTVDASLANDHLIIDGVIANGGATAANVTKTGFGTMVLQGSAPNIYTGTTTVNQGTLALAKDAGVDAVPGNLVIGDNVAYGQTDIVILRNNQQIADTTNVVTVNSSGLLDLNGFNETLIGPVAANSNALTLQINAVYSAVVDTNGGTLTLGGPATNSNVNVVNAGNTTFHSPAAVIRGNINLGDNPRRFDVVNSTVVSDAVNLDMSQAIVSGTGGLTKLGVGTLLLGVNNATGTTNVLDGLVILSGTHAPDLVVGDGIGADNTAQVWMTASDLIANTANVRVNAEGVWLLGMNAVQGISITSTPATFFTLTFDDGVNQFTTRPIATNATAAVVQTALQDLPNINIGDVLVTGGTDVFGIRYFTIQFRNGDPRSSTGLGLQAINPLIISAIPGQPALFPPDMQTDIYAGASQSQTIAELTMERGVVTTPGSADIATGTGTLTMTGDMTLLNRGATINTSPPATITGNLNLAGASRIFSVVDSATAGAATDLLIMATISNGGIIKTNTGTLELGGFQDNTYALATEIQVGAILLAKARVNEIQAITVDPSVTAGQFTISYGGYTTAPLNFNATTAQVQTQLLSLPSIGAGGVAVAGSPGAYEVTFIGNLANANVEEMTVANLSLVGGDVSVFTARDGQSDEIQTISLDGGVTGGTFTINFNGRTTAPIAFNATAAAVQAALQALAPEIGTGNVTVLGGGGANGVYTLIFRNGLGSANVPEVTVDATSLIGGGATVATVSDGFSFNAIPTGTIIIGDGAGTDALNLGASHQIGDLVAVTMLDTTGVPQFNLNGFSEEIGSLASAGTNAVVAMGGNNPTLTTGGNNASTTFNGVISSSVAGMGNLTKVGTGEFTLAGTAANTFTGTTWIREGVLILQKTAGVDALRGPIVVGDGIGGQDADELRLGASNQIQDAATVTITITQSGLFDLNGFIETITGPAAGVVLTLELGPTASARITNSDLGNPSTLTLGGAAGASNVNVVALAGTDDTSPPVLIDGNLSLSLGNQTRTFTVADTETPSTNTDLRVEVPVIQSAATGALIKAGPGTMTLNALNTYTGATTVNDGILGGNGTLTGPLTINSGATLSPGDNGTGIFTVNNNVTFNAGAFYFVEINGPTVGTEYDRLSVNGNVSIDNSATLVGSTVFDIANGVSFIIIEKVSAGLITGAFGNADQLSPPDVVFVGGKSYIYNFDGANYVGGSGRDLELNSVKTTREWDGESLTTNNWTDAVNWVGDVAPFVGDDLLFRNLGLVRPNPFNDFAPDTDFGLITIDATGGSYDLQGNRVRFADATGGILHQSGTHTISLDLLSATNPLTLTSNGTQLNVNGAITLGSGLVLTGTGTNAAINGDIGESGSQTVTKQGAGTWTLAGNNTYTGLTTVSAGTLQVDGGSAILDTNTVNVNVAGATLALLDDETIGTLNGVAGGIVQLNANTLTVGAGSFAGNINGSGGLTKNTAGILTLSGTNSYTGVTNIDAGTLQVMGGSALVDTGTVSVNIAGATFELLNDETIGTLNGVAGGIVQLNANTLTVGAGSFAGAINGSGGLTKNTAGILLLNGTNGYTGTTNIDAGTLRVDGGSALVDTGTVSVNTAGATFELLADETIGTLNGVANSTVQLNANTLTVGAGNFLGVIDGTGGLTKTTVGTLALGGVNTYTGTTNINGGFLLVNGSTAAGSTVEVNNTGTLGGTGTINGPVNVNSGGTINPGPNGAAPANTGILTVNNTVTFNLGSFFHVDINGTTPGTQHDQLTVTGTGAVIINAGATLVGTTDPLIINGLSFVVLNKASTGFISGAFTNANLVSPPATVSVGGKTYTYNFNGTNYVGGSGRDLVLTTTPTIRVWDGIEDGGANSGDNNWTNPLNWVGDAQPFAGDALFFNDVGVVNRNLPFNDFAAGFSFSSITFNTTLGNYTITGNAITMQATLGGGVFHSAGNNVLNIGLNMTASPQTVEATGGTLTIGGAITLGAGANLSVNANPGNVIFNNTIDGDQTLTTSGAGTVRFADTVGATTPLVSLTTSNAGVTEIFTSVVRTNGAQSYNNPVLVDSPTNLLTITTLAGGNVSFASTLRGNTDGEDSITINSSGTTTFGGAVGDSGQRLNNLLVNSTGVIAINGGSVTTLGNQTYNQAVTLGAAGNATTLTGVDVFFASTVRSPVNGQQALTVNASGVTTFAGAVGDNDQRLASLTTNAGGTTRINGGSVTTTGDQTYNDVVTLGADTILTGANITFDDTLDSAGAHRHLTVNGSATTRFNGWVGFTLPLASLTTNAGGTTVIDAGEVHTIGNQTYNDPVILESDTLLNAGGTVHFATTVNSAATEQNDLTITANTLIFGGNVGFGTNGELGDLIVSTATALNLSVSIRAAGDMFFEVQFDTNPNRQITINNNSTIMSLGGDITFEASTGFTLASGSTLSATAGSIFVTANYTLAAADGIAVLLQGIVNATQMTITGGDLADTFTIAPSATTPIDVAGLLPVAPVVVGDALFIIMAGVTNPKLTITAPGDGFWTFGNRQTVTFTSIERFNFTEIRATGTGPGGGPHVKVWDSFTGQLKFSFFAYNGGFTGGVRVAVGDVTGDGIPDIITAPGAGGGPHIRVFDGVTGQVVREFFAYAPSFTGGVFVAVGDVNGDGVADIITAPGAGGGPHVKVFDGVTNAVIGSFFAYAPSFTGGVTVAAGDVTGNGMAEVITGAGAGGGPHVRTFNGMTGAQIAHPLGSFFAYHSSFTGGVFVAAGDINGDGRADIVTGPGAGGGPHVKAFSGANGGILASFMAFEPAGPGPINQVVNDANLTSGVRVAVTNVNGLARFFVSLGANAQPRARVFDAATLALIDDFFAYDPAFLGGVFVGGSNR